MISMRSEMTKNIYIYFIIDQNAARDSLVVARVTSLAQCFEV